MVPAEDPTVLNRLQAGPDLRAGDDAAMWVRVMGGMLTTGEALRPVAGGELRAAGLRVRGAVVAADDATADGVVDLPAARGTAQGCPEYQLTGVASDGRDVWAQHRRRRGSTHHAGAEFVLSVGGQRYQVHHGGSASDVAERSRVTVIGAVELVAGYEWEDFGLPDTRSDWFIERVVELSDGDALVDLGPG
jgi:hypothetical protein